MDQFEEITKRLVGLVDDIDKLLINDAVSVTSDNLQYTPTGSSYTSTIVEASAKMSTSTSTQSTTNAEASNIVVEQTKQQSIPEINQSNQLRQTANEVDQPRDGNPEDIEKSVGDSMVGSGTQINAEIQSVESNGNAEIKTSSEVQLSVMNKLSSRLESKQNSLDKKLEDQSKIIRSEVSVVTGDPGIVRNGKENETELNKNTGAKYEVEKEAKSSNITSNSESTNSSANPNLVISNISQEQEMEVTESGNDLEGTTDKSSQENLLIAEEDKLVLDGAHREVELEANQLSVEQDEPELADCIEGSEGGDGNEDMDEACSSCSESLDDCLADRSASMSSISSIEEDTEEEGECLMQVDAPPAKILENNVSSMMASSTTRTSVSETGGIRALQTFDRVQITKAIWNPKSLSGIKATHILQGRENGTFLVQGREEDSRSYLLYVSDDCSATKVRQFTIGYQPLRGLHIADSQRYFQTIQHLVSFYCDHHQQQSSEPNLLLPKVIRESPSQKDLNSLSLLEQQFWDSATNPRHDDIKSSSRRPFSNLPLTNIQRLALKRQTSTDSGSDIALNKRGGMDLISRYGLHAGLKSDASVLTTDDEDFLLKRPHSEHDLNDSFGLEPSNWTYQKVSNSTTVSSQSHSMVARADGAWNQDTDYENNLIKKLSNDSLSVSTPGLTPPPGGFSSTPRMQREGKVFTFQSGRGYSVPSCLHNEYKEQYTKSATTISESKATHNSFTSGIIDTSRYKLKPPETTRVVSPACSEYTFKVSIPQVTSHNATTMNAEVLRTDRKQTTSSYIIRDNAPPVRLKTSEFKQPKVDNAVTTKGIQRMNTTPGTYSTSNQTKNPSSVFTFNVPIGSCDRSAKGSVTNSNKTLLTVNEHDSDRQASPIYALPCDALVGKVEHSRYSVNAIRAANKQSSVLKSMPAIDSKRSDSSASRTPVTVSRSSSDRTPRTARFNDQDVKQDSITNKQGPVGGRPPLPKLAPVQTDYNIPFDVTPSPKIQPRGRSQSLWAFNANTSNNEIKNNSSMNEVGMTTINHYEHLPSQTASINSSQVSNSSARSFDRSQTSVTKTEMARISEGRTPESDLEQIELRFFTPPSSCEVKELNSTSPLKFPTPTVQIMTEIEPKTTKTIDEVISNVYPNVTLRRDQKPFVMASANRISAYDNVGNSRPPSFRKTYMGSRTTLASSGTRYSQPWENWENLIGEVAAYENRQFDERENKAVDFISSTGLTKHTATSASKFVTKSEAMLTENIAENKNFSNPHRRCYESKSLTRPIKSNSSTATTSNENRFLTTDRKGVSQNQMSRAKSSTGGRSSQSKLLVEANDNFEYSEMESDMGDSEYFGMDVDIRPDDDVDVGKMVPLTITTFERSLDRRSLLINRSEASLSLQKSPDVIPLITGPKLISDKNRGYKLPGAKICYFIVNMAKRDDLFFGRMIQNFVDCTIRGQERNPRTVTQNIRQFMNGMKNYLVRQGEKELNEYIAVEQSKMNQNDFLNIDAIMERALLKCVIKPLHDFVYKLFVEEATKSGNLQLLSDGIKLARAKSIEDLGISAELISQHETAIECARHFLTLMEKSYSPLKKLENILGAVAYISNAVCSESFNSSQPSASPAESNDVLRILTYVLIQHGLISGEIEADYTWGLVHQSFLTGESRYHLATFSSAVNVIKSLRKKTERNNNQSISSAYEGFLQVVVPNEKQDKFGRHLLPVHPSMVTRDICSLMAHRLKLTNPQDYGLYSLVAKVERRLKDDANPHTVHAQAVSNFQDCVLVYRRNNATFIWPRDL